MSTEMVEKDEDWGGPAVYWSRVAKSDGFDIEGIPRTPYTVGLLAYNCASMPEDLMVKHYAMLGLHRYNMLEGTSLKLHTLLKYNRLQNVVSSYFMTLNARNSDDRSRQEIFQVRIDERKINSLDLTCSLARPKDKKDDEVTTKKPFMAHFHGCAVPDSDLFDGELPDWPSDEALNDTKRFYVLTSSDRQANDWINLYLQLLICANDPMSAQIKPKFMSDLQILKVAIETHIGDAKPKERLEAKCANVYITFKGLDTIPMIDEIGGEHVRKAIVRRVISPGFLTIVGQHWSGINTKKSAKNEEKARRQRKRYRFG
ncbi:hypothetical protein AALP_AA4G073300 [Arabis alpina]|uniref:Uncharacterized protein n=1 Tax=Arabis alpina TaxID=50452 RepID=A0A087H1R3_ARAAL|nr:hypothetical protein AALP_AA4G073300 [Arabis alpina]